VEKKIVLAKSPKDTSKVRWEETLTGHTEKVIESFRAIFGTLEKPTYIAMQWLKFFKLGPDQFKIFYVNGIASCALHDIGKANDGMDNALNRKGSQVIRHEHLSGLILMLSEVTKNLSANRDINFNIVISSVIGHHLKASIDDFANSKSDREAFTVYFYGVQECFRLLQRHIDLPDVNFAQDIELWSLAGQYGRNYSELKEELETTLYRWWRKNRKDPIVRKLLLAVMSSLIVSDSAGSGIVREGKDLDEWLSKAFSEDNILYDSDIEQKIIKPRIRQIEATGREFRWNDFQNAVEGLPSPLLLLAACGAGKTLAAWRWIKGQLSQKRRSRVIFLYPTRATATEGFKDYVSWAPEADAALIHGTSEYELEDMFNDPDDERSGRDFTTEERLFALAYWHKRIYTATVDQFLGFLQNSYASICLLPVLVDSVIVIDEVHSFDKSLFSALKEFITEFDIPVLCMTASLPERRVNDLIKCGVAVFPDKENFTDLVNISDMPRYKINLLESEAKAIDIAKKALEKNKKVLWVVNSVDRCQQIAQKFKTHCYHSRFKLDDRKNRHEEVIKVFRKKGKPVLVITTQVCEMSIDIDSDVLISELCPITAMIQRMGRNNRHAKPDEGKLGEVYFYLPVSTTPYTEEEMVGTQQFIDELIKMDVVSQSTLQDLLELLGPSEKENKRYTAFLEDGPWVSARGQSLRDTNDYTVPTVLDTDIERYLKLKSSREPIDGLIVSVPRKFVNTDSRLGKYPLVAPGAHYSPVFGFYNKPVEVNNE